jgi:hypothetical protein
MSVTFSFLLVTKINKLIPYRKRNFWDCSSVG